MIINSDETQIIGHWIVKNGSVTADSNCERISYLTQSFLIEQGRDESGWDALYKDPNDGRLWELIYPNSELQSGGPPQLQVISIEAATRKYLGLNVATNGDERCHPV